MSDVQAKMPQEDGVIETIIRKEEEILVEIDEVKKNVATKINRTDTRTFFLEPSKWSNNKYSVDTSSCGWTTKSILQINAPEPASNQKIAAGISISSQSTNQVELAKNKLITEPVIVTIVYCGEEVNDYFIAEDMIEQVITWEESRDIPDTDILALVNFEGDLLNNKDSNITDKSQYKNTITFFIKFSYGGITSYSPPIFGNQSVYLNDLCEVRLKLDKKYPTRNASNKYVYYVDFILLATYKDNAQLVNFYQADTFYDSDQKFSIIIDSSGATNFYYYKTSNEYVQIPLFDIAFNQKYHFRYIMDGNTVRIYRNGVLIGTATDVRNDILKGVSIGGYVLVADEIRVKNGLPENESENHAIDISAYKLTKAITEQFQKTILIKEKTWFERRRDGLYRYDKDTGSWVKE